MAQTKATQTSKTSKVRTIAGKVAAVKDPARTQALVQYESALKLMQDGKYEKAHAAFEKMLAVSPPDFADRIRMYLSACLGQAKKSANTFANNEEQYDYAISLLNDGNYEDARQHLQSILKKNSSADYAFYGLAVLSSMTGDSQTCLEHLTEAIRLNARNRIQARSDSDFGDMTEDPRFTELLYPEA